MHDSEVVAAIVAGDPGGLAEAYDRYAAQLYTYCRTLLREPADAADAVQDTFVIAASRLSALREPGRFRSWLYAVARNECHRRLRGGSTHAPLDEAPDVTDESSDVHLDTERAELRDLVNTALGGVGPAEREVLELQLRRGLDGGEVAAVLGIGRNHAHALLSRARDQLHTSLGVLLVARSGRQDCKELDDLLTDWDGRLTVLVRKRVNRHIEHCSICSGRRRRELAPAMFLGITPVAALPALVTSLPPGLREQVLGAHAAAHVPAVVPLTKAGFPKPLFPARPGLLHARPVHVGAATASAAGIAIAVGVVTATGHHGVLSGAAGPTPSVGASALGGGAATSGSSGSSGARGGSSASGGATAVGVEVGHTGAVSPQPGSGQTGVGTTGTATSGPTGSASASPTASASSSSVAAGALSVSPTTIVLAPLLGGTITLTASGGPVSWSISIPSGLLGNISVSPSSGTLAAGSSTTVTISVSGLVTLDTQLTVTPGNEKITIVLGAGLLG